MKVTERYFKKVKCSIGICVYNEDKNILHVLNDLKNQTLKKVVIDEIFVISSGSTDKTISVVKTFAKKNKRVKILIQSKREGKASAVNLFVSSANNEILVLMAGDIILSKNVIENLVNKFLNLEVGMTGAHPIPINKIHEGFCAFAGNLLWDLHHRVSLNDPKMGEMIAFRKIFRRIPILSSVDEANIEPLIRGQGYKIIYVPNAKIYNKAPTNIKDLIKQRRRIYSGHLAVKHEQSYEVATMNPYAIFYALFSFIKDNPKPKYIMNIPLVILVEMYSRFLGWWDYRVKNKRHNIWDIAESTKNVKSIY